MKLSWALVTLSAVQGIFAAPLAVRDASAVDARSPGEIEASLVHVNRRAEAVGAESGEYYIYGYIYNDKRDKVGVLKRSKVVGAETGEYYIYGYIYNDKRDEGSVLKRAEEGAESRESYFYYEPDKRAAESANSGESYFYYQEPDK